MPARVNGNYYVHYVGQFAWSHFEATGTNSLARQLIQESIAEPKGAALVYPNPVTQRTFTIRVPDPAIKQVTVTLTDIYGNIVMKKEVKANEPIIINSSIATGIYNVTAISKNTRILSTKLVIR